MPRLAALVLLACSLAPPARAGAPPGPLVAVLEFRNRLPEAEKAAAGERPRFAAAVRTALRVKAPAAKVMTVDEMHRLAAANPDGLDKCNDESCVEVGRLLGADAVVEGVLARKGKLLEATLRLYDVRKGGDPIATVAARGKDGDALLRAVGATAGALAKHLGRPQPAPAAAPAK